MSIDDKQTTGARQNEKSDLAIAEFLARGGTIQQIPTGKSGYRPGEEMNVWGRKIKPVATDIEQDSESE